MKSSKKFILLKAATFFIFIVFAAGCASTGRETVAAESGSIALVSVVANYDINWRDEEKTASGTGKAIRRMRKIDPDWSVITKSESIIDVMEQTIYDTLSSSPLIHLAPKEDVLNSHAYSEAKPASEHETQNMIKPSGYRFINLRDKDFRTKFTGETGIPKTLYITLNLTKSMASGFGKNGKASANVIMTVIIKDSLGKYLWNKTYKAQSPDKFKVSAGAYSGDELLAFFPPMIKDVCLDFLTDLEY
jgi:hypothetical protein